MRFSIRYSKPWRWLLPIFLLPARLAYISIDDDVVKIRMSWAFRAKFAKSTVAEVSDFHPVVSIGVHGFRGRWLVNGAHRPIARIRLSEPIRGRIIGLPLAVREILVSVEDRDTLRSALSS
ncbi:MAG: hypothetical protein ACLPVY_25930 [Acidimicrobiia bacterium]